MLQIFAPVPKCGCCQRKVHRGVIDPWMSVNIPHNRPNGKGQLPGLDYQPSPQCVVIHEQGFLPRPRFASQNILLLVDGRFYGSGG